MTRAGKSIFYFGFWVLACGIGLMFFPGFCLGIADIRLNDYLMVRLFGMILIYLAIYYFVAGRRPAFRPLYLTTVFTRSSALLIMILFVLLGMAKPIVIGFTAVDALGALWTALALRADGKAGAA
ncbi:MAG TPA: hypothetical protein PKN50_09905 [Spirochaetota bacterium]|nr:hypothetical protein [Spirochaetota bacterium]HPV42637.1 hypothetical protein [Spirochaetota bacterium]